ncbi:MAG: hypothetical protein L3J82_06090 [Planctomycetes bacterium]|nr:hypothetical protein [Planctomycetota bacterium]
MTDKEHPDEELTPELPLTVDSPIWFADALICNRALRAYYKEHNIKCFDCCAADETWAEGAKVHEGGPCGAFEPKQVVKDLNELAKKHPYKEETAFDPRLLRRILDFMFPSEAAK